MNNTECTVTIADIYGAEWWERNKAELEREWEWGFGVTKPGDKVLNICLQPIDSKEYNTAIILHRRKPKPPTLREVYGVDEVTIPVGWEWTGEWRVPEIGMSSLDTGVMRLVSTWDSTIGRLDAPRLILRDRPKKVWFKAEEKARIANFNDWIWDVSMERWVRLDYGGGFHLCATRHEEIDQTVQVVTQAMVDGVSK